MKHDNRKWLSFTLFISVLAVAAISCSAINLPFGGGGEAESEVVTEATSQIQPTEQPATEPADDTNKGYSELPIKAGACANSLMPLEVGNQWVYVQYDGAGSEAVAEGEPTPTPETTLTWTVVEVEDDIALIDMQAEDLGINAEYTLQCEDGAILTFPTFTMELSLTGGGSGEVNINYEHSDGEFLPSIETLEANNWDHQWTTDILISGGIASQPVEGQVIEMTFEESPWTMNWSTEGPGDQAFESVRTAAGTFDEALKLKQDANMDFNMVVEGLGDLEADFTSEANQWFVQGIGLVKTQSITSSISLNDMELPFSGATDFTSTMELKEFRQGVDVGP